MTTIDTDQETIDRWLAAGRWEQFSPGDPVSVMYPIHNGPHDIAPPADWESQPCETCDGNGGFKVDTAILYGIPGGEDWGEMCPDCNGSGVQRLAVTVPCPRCEGGKTIQTWDDDLGPLTQPCPDCQADLSKYEWSGATGRITVAWATVKWGPLRVIDGYEMDPPSTEPGVVVLTDGTTLKFAALPPDVDPASLIGQFARGGSIEPTNKEKI